MAYFAELDSNNVVVRVLAVNNTCIVDGNGVEQEALGIKFMQDHYGPDTQWVQTSYNKTMRKNYAGPGQTFDKSRDAFIPPQPFKSWTLDDQTCQWVAPTPYPQDGNYYQWDEASTSWAQVKQPGPQ